MSDTSKQPLVAKRIVSELAETKVHVTSDKHLQIEFRIDDLIRKLVPGYNPVANCGGCHGCMGCSM
jgi:hypothetical protein